MMLTSDAINVLLIVVVVITSVAFISVLLGRFIYKVKHHIPTGDCASCQVHSKKMLEAYHKEHQKG